MGVERAVAAALGIVLASFILFALPSAEAATNFYEVQEIEPETVNTTGWVVEAMGDDFGISSAIAPTPFYDRTVEEIWFFSNGFVGMGDYDSRSSDTGCCEGGQIPSDDGVNGIVAGTWSDLDPRCGGTVSRKITQESVRVAFEDVPYYGNECLDTSDRVTFWIEILASNGTVEVHVLEADGGINTTTGIEDFSGTDGNQTRRTDASLDSPVAWRFTLQEGSSDGGDGGDGGDGEEPLAQDDAGSGGDAGDNASTAYPITEGSYTGTLDPDFDDTEDWYAIELTEGDELAVDLDPDADFEVAIHDPNVTELDRSGSGDGTEHVQAVASEDGTHYIRVWSESGRGDYRLDVDVREPVPSRVETMRFSGTIDCAIDVLFVTTRDLCAVTPATRDETFPVGFDRGLTEVRTELVWDRGDALRPAFRMRFTWTNLPGLHGAEGPSPVVRVQETAGLSWADTGRDGQITVEPTQANLAVVDQPFDLCTWAAYGDATLPADPPCG